MNRYPKMGKILKPQECVLLIEGRNENLVTDNHPPCLQGIRISSQTVTRPCLQGFKGRNENLVTDNHPPLFARI